MVQFADPSRISKPVSSGEMGIVEKKSQGGAALHAGADALASITGAIKTRQDADRQNDLDNAEVEAALLLTREQNAYNDDPDYGTIVERSTKNIDEGISKVAASIKNPKDREMFMMRQKLGVEKTQEHLKGVKFAKERDYSRAAIDTQLADLREMALVGDPAQASELVSRRLESAVAKGYYGAEEAADLKQRWQVDAATGRLSMMEPEKQIEALGTPWAEKLPVDVRAKLKKTAEEKLIVGKAQAFSDDLMKQKVTLDGGLTRIQKQIKDPEERKAAEERFKMDYETNRRAKQDNQDDLHSRYSLAIEQGMTVTEIMTQHKGEWESLRPAQRENLKNVEAQKNAPPTSSDPAALARVVELSANGRHDDVIKMLTNNSSAFSKADREQYLSAAAKGKAAKSVTDIQLLSAKVPGEKKKPQRDSMLVSLNQWRNDFVETQGKDPTPDQVEKQVDRMLMDYDRDPSGWGFGDTKPVWKLQQEEQMKALEAVHKQELKEEDPENYDDTETYIKSRGMKVDRYQFEEVYKTQQLVTSIKRRDPDGYSAVMEYFNPGRDMPNFDDRNATVPSHSDFLKAYRLILEKRNASQ